MARFYVRPCPFKKCKIKKAYYGTTNPNDGWWCFIHKKKYMKKIAKSVCQYKDCDRPWVFATDRETTERFCYTHKKPDMIDVKYKMCINHPTIRASYAKPGSKYKELCGECSEKIGGSNPHANLCKCPLKKQAVFNWEGETKGLCCVKCKEKGMIDVKSTLCIKCNKTRASFGKEGTKKKLYCKQCSIGIKGIVLIGVKMCEKCNNKQAHYGSTKEFVRRYCSTHKKKGMKLLYGNFCEKCKDTIAVFGDEYDAMATRCKKCADKGMIDIVNKKCIKCIEDNVKNPKQGKYNVPTEKCGKYCLEHKTDDMINVQATYCKKGCGTQVCTNKYKGFCLDCYKYKFPYDPVFRTLCVKEKYVQKCIEVKLDITKLKISFNKPVSFNGINKRPDILIRCGKYRIIVEIDEFQHKSYDIDNDNTRNNFLWEALGKKPIVIIRFNPDGYKSSNKTIKSSPWEQKNGNITLKSEFKNIWCRRMKLLIENIQYWLDNTPVDDITIKKLYYDK
jgi:hypothetical protein